MLHRVRGRKFGQQSAYRKALKRNLLKALFTHGRIITTLPKAKEYRPFAEKLITLAKKADAVMKGVGENDKLDEKARKAKALHYRRQAMTLLGQGKLAVNGTLSLDDIRVLPLLRSAAVVKGLRFPNKVRDYFETMMNHIGYAPLPAV